MTRSYMSDSPRRGLRLVEHFPSRTWKHPSAPSRTAASSPIWVSSDAAPRRDTRASAPTSSTVAGGWPPTFSAWPPVGPPTVAASSGSSSLTPRTRPGASTGASGSNRTPATPRRTASRRAKAALRLRVVNALLPSENDDQASQSFGSNFGSPTWIGTRTSDFAAGRVCHRADERTSLPIRSVPGSRAEGGVRTQSEDSAWHLRAARATRWVKRFERPCGCE
jgi:hypothetical protein